MNIYLGNLREGFKKNYIKIVIKAFSSKYIWNNCLGYIEAMWKLHTKKECMKFKKQSRCAGKVRNDFCIYNKMISHLQINDYFCHRWGK